MKKDTNFNTDIFKQKKRIKNESSFCLTQKKLIVKDIYHVDYQDVGELVELESDD